VMQQSDIAELRQPSMAGVLSVVVGPWGAVFVSVGLLISVLGAYLAWSLICAEVLFAASKTEDMPRAFCRENKNGVPSTALWLTNIIVQLLVISTYWSNDAFSLMLNLTSSMSLIPYFLVAAFGFMLAKRGETYEDGVGRNRDLTLAGIAVLYTAFMVFAGGMKFVLLSALLYLAGSVLYYWARREQGRKLFNSFEFVLFVVAWVGCIAAITGLVQGWLTI